MTKIKLEYSEAQQCFHYNTGDSNPNTNSYKTICDSIELGEAEAFVGWIYYTYNSSNLTFSKVLNEFKYWQE